VTTTPAIDQPLPFRLLLDEAVRLARQHFRRVYVPVALPLSAVAGLAALAQGLLMWAAASGHVPNSAALVIGGTVGFIVSMFGFMVVYLLSYAVLFAGAVEATAGREVSMARAWRFVLRPAVLGTILLSALAVTAGFGCCLLPGIYLGLILSLVVPVMVEEGLLGTDAMRRSVELTSYNPRRSLDTDPRLKAFVILFVGTLLGYAINMMIQLPVVVVQQYLMMRDMAGGSPDPASVMARMTWLQVPSQMLGMLVSAAVHLYMCFGLALLFMDVRRRKEGLDLEAAIAHLSQPPPATP
jgi:hypothetical protein